MAALEVTVARAGADWRVRAVGELDVSTVRAFAARLDEVVGGGEGDVTVDLRPLTFLDSSGLHALLNLQRRLTRQDRRLGVLCRPGEIARVFELTRLTDTLRVKVTRRGR